MDGDFLIFEIPRVIEKVLNFGNRKAVRRIRGEIKRGEADNIAERSLLNVIMICFSRGDALKVPGYGPLTLRHSGLMAESIKSSCDCLLSFSCPLTGLDEPARTLLTGSRTA